MRDEEPSNDGEIQARAVSFTLAPKAINRRQAEQMREIVIRAHYLSMELRDICAVSGVAPPQISLAARQMLKSWALAFAQELERASAPSDSS
jgi:hypothetical protein